MPFTSSYKKLPHNFYAQAEACPFPDSELLLYNEDLAATLNLNICETDRAVIFSGQKLLQGSQPIALAYAGHQFGHFNPQLGDGRALLLGEHEFNGQLTEIQLKGSGPTYFSRGGDGFCPLGPALREYLISESLFHLGIPTTRSLAVVKTNATVYRETPLPGAIVTRTASSHIRIGTFEFLAQNSNIEQIKTLTDFAIQRHAPELTNEPNKYNLFFEHVCKKTLSLISQWMGVGFIHGVMNTDNFTISGETIDFGPCAFMDQYQSQQVFSFIDRNKRYCYQNQPTIALWNLGCLTNALFPILQHSNETQNQLIDRLNIFFEQNLNSFFQKQYLKVFTKKLGFFTPQANDKQLIETFLSHLQEQNLDFTESFRSLNTLNCSFKKFEEPWLKRLHSQEQSLDQAKELMNRHNPITIPRNHLVEKALADANRGNLEYFNKLYSAIKKPFDEPASLETPPPRPEQVVKNTFCGT